MGHLVSQTDTRTQHHHLPKSPSTSRHRLTSLASQNIPPTSTFSASASTKPPLLPSTPFINLIVDLSQQPLPADEAQGVAWASLLRPSTTSSPASASAGPLCNALPTSSVVGISTPAASTTTQDAALHVPPSRRSELVRLLTSGPGTAHPTATTAGVSYASTMTTTTTTANITESEKRACEVVNEWARH